MSRKDFLSDIDCPQFVDFEAGLSEQDDVFFESSKQDCTPVSAVPRFSRRAVSTKFNNPTMRPLFDKKQRTASVRAIQMHPKPPKPTQSIKEKLEKSPCVNLERRSPYEAPTERHTRRRSQSESNIEDSVKKKVGFCVPILRKRSLSADDVRVKRKATCPTTPLCLKRPKRDKQIKTSEQLELEKIAQLQKELSDHLRFNEMSMKRLALKKRINPAVVELPVKTSCVFKAPEPPREVEKYLHKKSNASNNLRKVDEEARSKFRKAKAATQFLAPPDARNLWSSSSTISCSSKSDAEKSPEKVPKKKELTSKHFDFLEPPTLRREVGARRKENRNLWNSSTVSCSSKSDAEKSIDVIPKRALLQSLNNSTHSCCSKSDAKENMEVAPKRPLGVKNTGFHSGIKFSAIFQKVKPFAIEKCKEGNSKAVTEPCLPSSQNIPSTRNMKENVPLRSNVDGGGH